MSITSNFFFIFMSNVLQITVFLKHTERISISFLFSNGRLIR
jgi:hypothetical protein